MGYEGEGLVLLRTQVHVLFPVLLTAVYHPSEPMRLRIGHDEQGEPLHQVVHLTGAARGQLTGPAFAMADAEFGLAAQLGVPLGAALQNRLRGRRRRQRTPADPGRQDR